MSKVENLFKEIVFLTARICKTVSIIIVESKDRFRFWNRRPSAEVLLFLHLKKLEMSNTLF